MGCHFLLQGILPTERSNPHLLHCQADSLPLSHLGNLLAICCLFQVWNSPGDLNPSGKSLQGPCLEVTGSPWRAAAWRGPDSPVGKESACDAGDPGLIPGLGRSAGEGMGYPLQYSWASLVAQLVKNLSAMRETWV